MSKCPFTGIHLPTSLEEEEFLWKGEGGVMDDKCPFCGEPYMESIQKYGCDFLASTPIRSQGCYARQISALQASRDRWRKLAMINEILIKYPGSNQYNQMRSLSIAALKEAGEWEI